jgi:hypothetical protein
VVGFWGGLPFWIIVIASLILVWCDFWDSCVRKNNSADGPDPAPYTNRH